MLTFLCLGRPCKTGAPESPTNNRLFCLYFWQIGICALRLGDQVSEASRNPIHGRQSRVRGATVVYQLEIVHTEVHFCQSLVDLATPLLWKFKGSAGARVSGEIVSVVKERCNSEN